MVEESIIDFTTKLNGIILKKAELENDFDRVYSMVFERMYAIEGSEGIEGDDFLFVLGEIGG